MAEQVQKIEEEAVAATPPKPEPLVVPDYPKNIYNEAHVSNDRMDFEERLMASRAPPDVKPYVPPPVPDAIAERTRQEMQAGAKRVEEFKVIEQDRRIQAATRAKEPWEGETVEVFRPGNFEEYKNTLRQVGNTTSKDNLTQPRGKAQ